MVIQLEHGRNEGVHNKVAHDKRVYDTRVYREVQPQLGHMMRAA